MLEVISVCNMNDSMRLAAYGCIYSRRIKRNDEELHTTKVYQELQTAISQLSGNAKNIECKVDILTAMYRKRKHFDQIIADFTRDFQPKSPEHARAAVLITDILSLGTTAEEVKENFLKLYDARIGLHILRCTDAVNNLYHFTTVDKNFLFKSPAEIQALVDEIPTVQLISRGGRKKKDNELTRAFILYYWLYESYFLREPDVLENEHFKSTKWSFHAMCDRFEQSPYYQQWEQAWTSFPDVRLDEKPKRHSVLPDRFDELMSLIEEQNVPLEEACYKLRIPSMTPLTYQRLKLKQSTGKSGMSSATKKYFNLEYAQRCLDSFLAGDNQQLKP